MRAFDPGRARALPGPAALASRREQAAERFASASLPTPDLEVWRYSIIDQIDLDRFGPPAVDATYAGLPLAAAQVVDAVGGRAALVVTLDGRVVESDGLAGLVEVASGPEPLDDVDGPHDAFGDLHDAFSVDPLVLEVGRGKAVERPVVVVHLSSGGGALAAPRLAVHAGEGAEVSVVEVFASAATAEGTALVLPRTSVVLDQAANVRYAAVQALGPEVWSIAHLGSRLGRDATATTLNVALGARYARVRTDTVLDGQGGTASLLAAYFGDGEQMHDYRTQQDHVARNTTSDLLFKGAVAGRSHGVYSGLIRVRNGARGTRAYQTNRNLVLSEQAGADSVPNLEIDENDLACSHASAVGPIDEQQRFYLEARGVPTAVADRLVALGFLDEVLLRSPVSGVRAPLALTLAQRLEEAGA